MGTARIVKSPNASTFATCVLTPTATVKGYLPQVDKNNMNSYIPRRKQREFIPEDRKDEGYWGKKRKNTESARRSRKKRRYHDMTLENQTVDLSLDNCKLRNELTVIKKRFGIPLNETFISDDDDPPPPAQRPQPPRSNMSPPRTPAQHAIPPATLGQTLQHMGPSVQQKAVRARGYSLSIALPYQRNYSFISGPSQENYSITNTQIPPHHTSVLPIDIYYPNTSGQRESGSRYYPMKVEPQDYSSSKSWRGRDAPIPMSGRSDLKERSAYSSNVSPSLVPQ